MRKKLLYLGLFLALLVALVASGASASDGEPPCTDGHSWDEGVVTDTPETAPCETKTYTCTVCGETKSVLLLPAVNGYGFDTVEPYRQVDILVGIADFYCPGLDAYEFYFHSATNDTWTDCVYRHEADSRDPIYLSDFDFGKLTPDIYDAIMVKSVSDSEGYEPGVFTESCLLTVDVEDMDAPGVQVVAAGGTDNIGSPSYYTVISGLTVGETYQAYWRASPNVSGPQFDMLWTADSDTYSPLPLYSTYSPECPYFLLRTQPEVSVQSSIHASISFRRCGGWIKVDPSVPADDSSFLSDLHIDTGANPAPTLSFTAAEPGIYSQYAIDFSLDGGETWEVSTPTSPYTFEMLTPDSVMVTGEPSIHYNKVRILAFGSAGAPPKQHIADCDITFTERSALPLGITYFQNEQGFCCAKVTGLQAHKKVDFASAIDGNRFHVFYGYPFDEVHHEDGTADVTFMLGDFLPDESGTVTFTPYTDPSLLEGTCLKVTQYLETLSEAPLSLTVEYFSAALHPADADHVYAYPQWNWSEDYQSAEAVFSCISTDGHSVTVPAKVTPSVFREPTCTENGSGFYAVSVEFQGRTYNSLKNLTNAIPPLGHDYEGGVCTRCGDTICIPGDINGDGNVNSRDAFRLFQYVSGFEVEVNAAACDVNGDGNVNSRDAFRLFQYVSGFDVEIH